MATANRVTAVTTADRSILSGEATSSRVLYVVDEIATLGAGTEGQIIELLRGLDRRRFDPHIAVFRPSEFVSRHVPFVCPVHELKIGRLASPQGAVGLVSLTRLVSRLNATVAHIFFNDAAVGAPAFCRLGGARVVVSRRDMGFWYTAVTLAALRQSNRFVDAVVANSDAVRQNVHARERVPLERIRVIPNGHNLERFESAAAPDLRSQLGIPANARIVGMVANLFERKRQADLIRTIPELRRRHDDVHVVLVGQGEQFIPLMHLAGELGQSSHVHILTGVSDAVPIIKHFDVAVLCSDSEGLSNALIEYALCSRSIVCTNVGGNREVVTPENGVLVERGDVDGLAAAIGTLLSDPGLRARLGSRARELALGRYDLRAMVGAYGALYSELGARVPAHNAG